MLDFSKLSKPQKIELLLLLEEKRKRKARSSILDFVRYTKEDYQVNWHHRALAKKLDAFVRGEIQFLMVFMPPRHGKSELVSRALPAYLHGIYPDCEIMAASYLDSLAGDMCIAVQNIIDSKAYKELFPETRIFPPGTSYTKGTRNSSEHHIVGRRGKYRGQGVGGSFTGKGANFICFTSGTKVGTFSGNRDISLLEVGDYVWSFNHEKGIPEPKRVEAVFCNRVSRLVQVSTAGGRQVRCTPDHPFYSTTRQEYRQAKDLRGDGLYISVGLHDAKEDGCHPLVRTLQRGVRKAKVRIRERIKKSAQGVLLLKQVLASAPQHKEPETVCGLQESGPSENNEILQQGMSVPCRSTSINSPILKFFSRNQAFGYAERWFQVLAMRVKEKALCSPFGREQKEQPSREPDHPLFELPHESSPRIGPDSVSRVIDLGEGPLVDVYDIRVEGNHNFFAEGILVHNCIDDPIKGREIADSVAFRERLWKFWQDDLFSRLETNLVNGRKGQVLITQTRWHTDDLAGRVIEQMRNTPGAAQWDIVEYPAIRVDNDDATDPREVGDALWPAKYNVEQLAQIKAVQGPRGWSSLYQQNPVPDGGGLFNSSMFEFIELPGAFDWSFITADTAYKEKQENDFNVFSAWGVIKDRLFLRGVWSKQMKAVDVEDAVLPFIQQYRNYGFRGAYIEPKGHGIYLNQSLARKGVMIPSEDVITEFYKDRRFDKVERANNVVPHLAARKIYINKDMGMKEDLVAQCLGFPKVKHDDFVDTVVDALKLVYAKKISMFDVA